MGVNFKLGSAYLADKIDCAFRCPQVCEAQCNNCLLLLLLHIKFYRIYMKTTAGKLQGTWFEGLRNFSIEECYCSCSWMPPSHWSFFFSLKTLDTIGNCQRLVFTVGGSQHMHQITNLWKFELNRSSKLQDNNERKKYPCHTTLCAFRWLISRPQGLNLRSQNQIHGK